MMYVKKYLTGFNEVIQIKKEKMVTKCQILIAVKKTGQSKKDYVKKT